MTGQIFSYDTSFDPPAAVLDVIVSSAKGTRPRERLHALVDTGADISAIPSRLVNRLDLYAIAQIHLEGVEAQSILYATYAIRLQLLGHTIPRLEVVLTEHPFVILGRDVVNLFDLRLNGPEKQLEVLG